MVRSLLRVALIAMVASLGLAAPVLLIGGGVAAAATPPAGGVGDPNGGSITGCPGNLSGTAPNQTYTLSGPCATTAALTIDSNITTLDGAGNTISASDAGFPSFSNGIVTVPSGQTVAITNLTVSGPVGGFQFAQCDHVLYGIWFNGSSGSVNNVTVEHIWTQQTNPGSPACNSGTAIRAEGPGTVTITGTKVMDYQKNGMDGRNGKTMNVSGSTIGPPHNLQGFIAANGLVYVSGGSGTATGNTIFGSGDQAGTGPDTPTDATAVLLFGATNVTITHNIITSDLSTAGTDIGISVTIDSTGIVLSFNQVGRLAPDVPDPTGVGITVCSSNSTDVVAVCGAEAGISSATLICNTFSSNWNTNILGALQIGCTPLPPGTQCQPYTAQLPAVQGGTVHPGFIGNPPFTWSTPGPLPPGLTLSSSGAITGTPTSAGTFPFPATVVDSSSPPLSASQDESITIAAGTCGPPAPSPDYRLVGSDGGVFVFGNSSFDGSLPGVPEYSKPIVGAAVTSTGNGYWMAGNDGSLFAFGDANFFGGLFGQPLAAPIVGIASPNDGGYWMAGADGGVFAFGDAPFLGSLVGTHLGAPIVGIASTPDGNGYWLVGADGGIFAFGDASFFGSLPSSGIVSASPVVGMCPTHDSKGYWLVAANGGVFAFGDAGFFGSAANLTLAAPIVGIVGSPDDGGYWLMGADGGVFAFGDAPFLGSMVSQPHMGPITSAIS
jgi:hypothetical protein